MFHDIIKVYADALSVAVTLQLPVSAPPAHDSDCDGDSDRERNRRAPLPGLAARLARRLGRRFEGALSAVSLRSFIRMPHL
jgi:hypothetical protein